ncbi:MAG: carboxy terminal-processing peptidase [Bacteroidetes bacterium]|nr:carboxy terminal-processing peptidase [Bacteroidota bacterium]
MKKLIFTHIFFLLVIFIISSNFTHSQNKIEIDSIKKWIPESYYPAEDRLVVTLMQRYHYKKIILDDSLSVIIFNRYIKSLDYNKMIFYRSDINNFSKQKYLMDDYIKKGQLEPAYNIFKIFYNRLSDRIKYVNLLLDKGFDFNIDEYYTVKRDSADWPNNIKESNELWRKRVKYDALNLLLAGKKWEATKKILKKRYNNYKKVFYQFNTEDVFQNYMNAFASSIDPHTNYLSPIASQNFNIDMSRSLEGIGARLMTEDEYTKVADIIVGGPAYKSKQLHRNDKIIGVAQGKYGKMVDIIGWRITEVVQLIRGKKGTIVRLQIIPASNDDTIESKEIELVRDKIHLNDISAKENVLDITNKKLSYKIGILSIPAFYKDFEAAIRGDLNYKSTTRDVRTLLKKLKKEKVNGVIVDLRNNGGGSLQEAISLTGLFIKKGPVVQVKNSNGSIDVSRDLDPRIIYSGPLAVLINRFSASASEIFSGAIQDYGRGIVIGETTYGKGTVQNMIDLNKLMPNSNIKLGQVKLTIAKFYRITGESTQNLGVTPDIQFPTAFDPQKIGESAEFAALPWDKIDSVEYQPFGNIKPYLKTLRDNHLERIKNDYEFQNLIANINEYKRNRINLKISLNKTIREEEKKKREEEKFKKENERRITAGLKLVKKGEKPSPNNKKVDAELNESAHILADYIFLTIG